MNNMVWVELNDVNATVRIFRNRRAAHAFGKEWIAEQNRSEAVAEIRHQLWWRCKGECELCASPVTEQSGHMHEQVHRGKGGEISRANSVFICPPCHQRAHKDRNPRFTKKPLDI
jgi:5-methylcytosine-specific restriction endonuclease McrA